MIDIACLDCGDEDEPIYMVHDHLWESVMGKDAHRLACTACFSNRLGRALTPDDFKLGVPCNYPIFEPLGQEYIDRFMSEMDKLYRG